MLKGLGGLKDANLVSLSQYLSGHQRVSISSSTQKSNNQFDWMWLLPVE